MKTSHKTFLSVAILTTGFLLMTCCLTEAATITWTNTASGNWSVTNNWNPNQAPGSNDVAVITNAGVTVTLDISPTVGGIILGTNGAGTVTLSLAGQTLTLNGPLTVNPSGSFTVDSGTMTGHTNAVLKGTIGWTGGTLGGVLTLATNSTLNITNTVNHFIGGCLFTNFGTVNWSSATLYSGGGAVFNNYGLWNAQDDQQINIYFGGSVIFNNYGTFRKSGGLSEFANATVFVSGVAFNQLAGVLDVQNGTNGLQLNLSGGGNFTGGYITTNQFGLTVLGSGNFNLNGTVTGTNTWADTGTFVGTNVINGALTWVGGTWNNTVVTVLGNSVLNINSANNHFLGGCLFTNLGTVNWSGGYLYAGGGAVFYNYGLWNAQDDQQLQNYSGGSTVFNNYGTFRKSGGASKFANATVIANGVFFNQIAGAIDVQNGTNGLELAFQGGANFTGGYVTTNVNGLTVLGAGNFNINGTVTGTNTWADTGTFVGTNVINGGLTWVGGTWNNTVVTVTSNSVLNINSAANHIISSCLFTNFGTVNWSGAYLYAGQGTIFFNYGLWNAQDDQHMVDYGGEVTTFNNYGTLRKSGGGPEFTNNTVFENGVIMNQLAGVIDVQNGTNGLQLAFLGGGNFTGGYATTNSQGLLNLAGGPFTLNGMLTGTNTWLNGGTLGTNANVINGYLTWVSGTWNGAGSVTIAPNSTVLVVGGAGNNDLNATVVTNYGTLTWVAGTIRGGNGTAIYNYGLWDAQSDQTLNNAYGGAGTVFNNLGTFRKSGGGPEFTNSTVIASGVLFNQLAGVLDVQNGTNGLSMMLQGGGNFTGGYITTNQFGLTVLNSGSFTINGTVTGANTWEDTGNLVGVNVINGALTWVGGNSVSWWNGATVTILSNSTVLVTGGAQNDMNSTVVTNYGTVTWVNGTIRGGNGTTIFNYNLWDCQSDQQFNNAYGGSGTTFNNFGTLRKSGGGPEFTNSTIFNGVTFNQVAGVLDVQNGTNGLSVAFQGGGNFTGGYITTNQFGLTVLSSGNFTLNGTVTGTNTWEDTGLLFGTNIIQGGLTWIGGNWSSAPRVTIATNSTVIMAGGGNNLDVNNSTITNNGTVVWSSGTLRGGGGGTGIYNNGVWNAQGDAVFNNAYGGSGTVFNNSGTFIKTAGTNNGTGSQFQSGVAFKNSGRLDCQAGVISLQGAYSLTNGTINFGINGLTNYGEINLAGAAPLVGTISANLNNGYIPISGNSFTNLYYGSYTGGFTNTVLPLADAWTTNYFPTYYVMTVLNSRPVFAALATNQFVVNELTMLNVTNTATDADVPAQTLVYSLTAGTNGMTLNSANGIFSWTPQQTNSPSTNIVSVSVTDNGTPTLSATNTFTVIVREVNIAPILPTLLTYNVNELTLLTITNTATNSNIHATITGYHLVSPPSNMVISASGVITWTPAQAQSPGTNLITTIVTNLDAFDLFNPVLTSTNTFTVIVKEVNVAPVLQPILTQTANLLHPISVTNSATEPNIHSVTGNYKLLVAPAGAIVNSSGVITWTPAQNQSLTTNTITTVVTNSNPYDLVNPHLSSTNSFNVIVVPNTVATNITASNSGGTNLTLSWPADHTGWHLEAQTNSLQIGLSSNWVVLTGSSATNQMVVPIAQTNGAVFFRMIYP